MVVTTLSQRAAWPTTVRDVECLQRARQLDAGISVCGATFLVGEGGGSATITVNRTAARLGRRQSLRDV
jgi:hypothetical protein